MAQDLITVRMPDGSIREFPAGTSMELIKLRLQMDSARPTPPAVETPTAPARPSDPLRFGGNIYPKPGETGASRSAEAQRDVSNQEMGKIFDVGLATTGMTPMGAGGRIALATALGGLKGAATEQSILGNAALEGGMESVAGPLGEGIRRAGNYAALTAGGVKAKLGHNLKPYVDAAMRTGERMREGIANSELGDILPPSLLRRAIPFGKPQAIDPLRKTLNTALAATEEASPPRNAVHISQFGSPSREAGLLDKARDSAFPISNAGRHIDDEVKFYNEHNASGHKFFTSRDLGNLKRNEGTSAEAVIRKYKEGEPIAADELAKRQFQAAVGAKAKSLQDRLQPGVKPINAALTDLHVMEEANDASRALGQILTDPGAMGVRGGLGAGTGTSIATILGLLGADPNYAAFSGLGGLAGILLGSPRAISSTSNALAQGIKLAPTAVRVSRFANNNDDEKKKEVKRREPSK